jgi:hypothetical protein
MYYFSNLRPCPQLKSTSIEMVAQHSPENQNVSSVVQKALNVGIPTRPSLILIKINRVTVFNKKKPTLFS